MSPRERFKKGCHQIVSDYMAQIGSKGGKAKGARKKRSTAHYKAAAAKRWAKESK